MSKLRNRNRAVADLLDRLTDLVARKAPAVLYGNHRAFLEREAAGFDERGHVAWREFSLGGLPPDFQRMERTDFISHAPDKYNQQLWLSTTIC